MKVRKTYWIGITLFCCLVACTSCKEQKGDPVAFLDGLDSGTALVEARRLIDSIAVHDPEELNVWVNRICSRFEEQGDMSAAIALAAYPYGIDPEERPETAQRLLTSALLPGKQAPLIDGLTTTGQVSPMIVFFYESRCRTCQGMVDELITLYGELQEAGIRIVAVSADTDPALFETFKSKFPWDDTLCDFDGYLGTNCRRWGVARTPMLFGVDKRGIVTGQYNSVGELCDRIFAKKMG